MGDRTKIEWTDATWNPVTGCSKVSPGCEHCYAERLAHRFGWTSLPWNWPNAAQNVRLHPERLWQPLGWKKPRSIFVCSVSDLFHEQVDEKYIAKVFAIMALTPQHTYQVLTKRPERMARLLNDEDFRFHIGWFASQATRAFGIKRPAELPPWPHPHVWLGVSAEDQRRAEERIPLLLETPAAVRFVSCEPLQGPVRLAQAAPCPDCDGAGLAGSIADGREIACETCGGHEDAPGSGLDSRLDWVIVGGESGPGARPVHPDWVRSIRDQCVAAGVPFFFKQWGEWRPYETYDGDPPPVPKLQDDEKWWERPDVKVWDARHLTVSGEPTLWSATVSVRVGRKLAGRELDGSTWDEMPRAEVVS